MPVVAALVAGAVALTGCDGSGQPSSAGRSSSAPPTAPPTAVVAAAGLDACPDVSGGTGGALPGGTLACLGPGPGVRMDGVRGPAVVNLWASWCGPCYRELPVLQRLHERAAGRVLVLGVDTADRRSAAVRALAETGVHFPVVVDDRARVRTGLRRVGLPVTAFVRADGSVAHVESREISDDAALTSLVRTHLGIVL